MAADAMKLDDEVSLALGVIEPIICVTCMLCNAVVPKNTLGYHWENNCEYFKEKK